MKKILWLFLILTNLEGYAQIRSLLKHLEERDFDKFLEKAHTVQAKKKQHAGVFFLKALYFADEDFAHAQADSAYYYVGLAIRFYQSDGEVKNELSKNFIGINEMVNLKNRLENIAFQKTQKIHTEIAYQEYIEKYASASLKDKAVQERDRLAFESAKRMNTSVAYKDFLDKYPHSLHQQEAQAAYEISLFQEQTDGTLASLDYFLQLYPQSPYRKEVERRIYFGFVKDHKPKVYKDYIDYSLNDTQNPYTMQAWWWLWFFCENKKDFLKIFPHAPKNYFHKYVQLYGTSLFPSIEKDKLVFLDSTANIRVNTEAPNLVAQDCQMLTTDFFLAQRNGKLAAFDFTGKAITDFEYEQIEEFSEALLKVKKEGKVGLVQKGGHLLAPCIYDNIETLGDYIKTQIRKKYGLMLPNSQVLIPTEYDEVSIFRGDTIALTQNRLTSLLTRQKLLEQISQPQIIGDFKWKNFMPTQQNFIKVQKEALWGIFDFSGKQILDFMANRIEETAQSWAILRSGKWYFYDFKGKLMSQQAYKDILIGQKRLALQQEKAWTLAKLNLETLLQEQFDDVQYLGKDIFAFYSPQKTLLAFPKKNLELPPYVQVNVFFATPQKMYIGVAKSDKQKGILDENGKVILEPIYQEIYQSENYFIVQKDDKKALYELSGKNILPLNYKSIVPDGRGGFLLQEKYFGFFKPQKAHLPCMYQSLPRAYDEQNRIFVVRQKDKYAFVDAQAQTLSGFAFDEISFFADTTALVRQGATWFLFDIFSQNFRDFTCDAFEYIKKTPQEVIIKYFVENKFALVSSIHGILCEKMQSIRNLATPENPFFLTEKSFENGIYQLFYIDQKGKKLRELLLDEENYQKMSCE